MKTYYSDGSPKGWLCVKKDNEYTILENKKLLEKIGLSADFVPRTKSQRAEYLGIIHALQLVDTYDTVMIVSDCENVILQMLGINRCKDRSLQVLNNIAHKIIKDRGLTIGFEPVEREENPAGVYLENFLKGK